MKKEKLLITPNMAKELLRLNKGNRPIHKSNLEYLTRQMAGGHWVYNGAPIIMSSDGALLDGQHRLLACINADRAFVSDVTYGISREAFQTLDTGARRTPGDVLSCYKKGLASYKASMTAAAALVLIDGLLRDRSICFMAGKVSNDEIVRLSDKYPGIEMSLPACRRKPGTPPGAVAVATHYLFASVDKGKADNFYEILATGQGLWPGDPCYALRERLIRDGRLLSQVAGRRVCAAITIKAWNAVIEHRPIHSLRYIDTGTKGENFPRISGLNYLRWS